MRHDFCKQIHLNFCHIVRHFGLFAVVCETLEMAKPGNGHSSAPALVAYRTSCMHVEVSAAEPRFSRYFVTSWKFGMFRCERLPLRHRFSLGSHLFIPSSDVYVIPWRQNVIHCVRQGQFTRAKLNTQFFCHFSPPRFFFLRLLGFFFSFFAKFLFFQSFSFSENKEKPNSLLSTPDTHPFFGTTFFLLLLLLLPSN